jgi:hypothetical protein
MGEKEKDGEKERARGDAERFRAHVEKATAAGREKQSGDADSGFSQSLSIARD